MTSDSPLIPAVTLPPGCYKGADSPIYWKIEGKFEKYIWCTAVKTLQNTRYSAFSHNVNTKNINFDHIAFIFDYF